MTNDRTIRIASLQYCLRPVSSFDEFARQAADWVSNAKDYKSRLVLFPEYFTLQLLSLGDPSAPLPDQIRDVAKHAGACMDLFAGLASKHQITVVAGTMPVLQTGGAVLNESHAFTPGGGHGVQAKLRMTRFESEDFAVSPANPQALRVFESDWGRFAIVICYDIEFPEIARTAAMGGAQVILVPSCTDDRQGYYRVRHCAQARAIENQLFVVQASTVGGLSRFPAACLNYGQAAILTPSDYGFARDGILAEGIAGAETMLVGDLDLKRLDDSRATGTVLPLRDSRSAADLTKQVEIVRL